MFAGIIEAVGRVVALDSAPRRSAAGAAHRLSIDLGPLVDGLSLGASVAVNGVCLTLADQHGTTGGFDVVPETWRRTNLRSLRTGDAVNLERALRVGDRIDGHFVQGHVDGTGIVDRIERGGEWKLFVKVGADLLPFIAPKGSIAIDGTSLTVAEVAGEVVGVALIPTTLARTVLAQRAAGAVVNIETDILAKFIVRRLEAFVGAPAPAADEPAGVTWDRLRAGGFLP